MVKKRNKRNSENRKDFSALKWIINTAKGSWIFVFIYALLSAALAYFGILTAYGTKDVVNGATSNDAALLKRGAIYLLILVVVQILLKIFNGNMYERSRARIEIKIRTRVFESIMKKDYAAISAHHSGDLLNRLTSDVQTICDGVTGLVPHIVSLLTKMISAVVIIAGLDWIFAAIFLAGGALIALISLFFRKYLKNIHKEAQSADGKVRSFFQESLASLLVIKVFNAYKQISEKAHLLQEDNYKIRIKRATISIFANTGVQMAFSLGYLFAMVLGGFRVYRGMIDIGELTAILQLVNQIQSPLYALAGVIPTYYSVIASAERIIEIENYADEAESDGSLCDRYECYEKLKEIVFDSVTFKYNRDYVFKNATAVIKKGDFVAITGISGIGKSTLLKLLLGVVYPQEGTIKIVTEDSEKQVDRNTRSLFSYVPQGNMLLSGTLRENVTFMCKEKSDEEIERAVKLSCSDDFVSRLPDGLETVVGERGLGLSEGQIQRIAIARAILYDAPIILFDEATSALDEETEERLLKNLRAMENKTCVIVSHKPAALTVCNKEIRIEDGKILVSESFGGKNDEN